MMKIKKAYSEDLECALYLVLVLVSVQINLETIRHVDILLKSEANLLPQPNPNQNTITKNHSFGEAQSTLHNGTLSKIRTRRLTI